MCSIKAMVTFNDHNLTDIPVLNPGDSFGKTWLLMQALQTRFVVIILTSVVAYFGMNGLLLWLMIKQDRIRGERNRVWRPGEETPILEALSQSPE